MIYLNSGAWSEKVVSFRYKKIAAATPAKMQKIRYQVGYCQFSCCTFQVRFWLAYNSKTFTKIEKISKPPGYGRKSAFQIFEPLGRYNGIFVIKSDQFWVK